MTIADLRSQIVGLVRDFVKKDCLIWVPWEM